MENDLRDINFLNSIEKCLWLLLNDFLAFLMSINSAFLIDQDPYMYRFDYLEKKMNQTVMIVQEILHLSVRFKLRISKRGCSIPAADRNRLLLKLNV